MILFGQEIGPLNGMSGLIFVLGHKWMNTPAIPAIKYTDRQA